MPELPEVETTRRGIEPHVVDQKIREVIVRRRDLRWPVSVTLEETEGHTITSVQRRSKYLLLSISDGTTVMIHLGMSGSLRVVQPAEEWKKHDHVALSLANGKQLRFHDPRRFGLIFHLSGKPAEHPLICSLGPEPLDEAFTSDYLFDRCARRAAAIKLIIMDAKIVVGVGNIYASEALFHAGIRPQTAANQLTKTRIPKLIHAIREVLLASIEQGGTTLRDFLNSDGSPGYFSQRLFVYGRKGEPCLKCGSLIEHAVLGQRATYWCPKCQKT